MLSVLYVQTTASVETTASAESIACATIELWYGYVEQTRQSSERA